LLPSPPPRDENGKVTPHDHPDILSDDGIIRRVDPDQHAVADPKSPTGKRLSSMLLKQSGGVSVDLQRPIEEDGLDSRNFVTNPKYLGSVRFTAGNLRHSNFKVGYDPVGPTETDDPENPYHGLLWGRISSSAYKQLMQTASWFKEIEGISLS
jgi:hypothetical protein